MSSNFIGLLIILFATLASVNLIMAMRNEPTLLAWLNQIFLGIILIALISYLIIEFGTRKMAGKEKEHQKEEHK